MLKNQDTANKQRVKLDQEVIRNIAKDEFR